MKKICTKISICLLIAIAAITAKAQTTTRPKTADNNELRMINDFSRDENGQRVEKVESELNDKLYRITLVDEKMTELTVDGEKIPAADWGKYNDAVSVIRQEMKEQAKRNAEQEVRNKEQEKRNAEQALLNEEQAKKNAEQAVRNQEQEKRNAEQVMRNKEQEKRNAEQAQRNELQAKKNEEQARANAQMIKEMTEDLVNDKIIPDTGGLREMKLNEFGMSVNGVKQPDNVFKKYRDKYGKFYQGDFSYSRDGFVTGN
ncbi:MAG TPA: hypothetical protein VHC47_05395 [Mucilaginibacter sp.]|nr:hypothetical protein [Mucilaginibacter sp.]